MPVRNTTLPGLQRHLVVKPAGSEAVFFSMSYLSVSGLICRCRMPNRWTVDWNTCWSLGSMSSGCLRYELNTEVHSNISCPLIKAVFNNNTLHNFVEVTSPHSFVTFSWRHNLSVNFKPLYLWCLILQSNQKVNARWTTDEQLLAVQGEPHHFIVTPGDQGTSVESAANHVFNEGFSWWWTQWWIYR